METKERRSQIDHRQSSRSRPSLFNRRNVEWHAQHTHRKVKELKDVGATPRSQKAVTSDDERIGAVFGRENGKSTEDLLEERNTLNDEQQNEDAGCGNGITLGNIHSNDEETEEEGRRGHFIRKLQRI